MVWKLLSYQKNDYLCSVIIIWYETDWICYYKKCFEQGAEENEADWRRKGSETPENSGSLG